MSKENYESCLEDLNDIPNEEVREPAIPVDIYVQEAADLAVWVEDEKEAMKKAGMDWKLAVRLPELAGTLRYAQSLWMKEFNTQEEARRKWELKSPEAFELKNDLEADCRFAFRKRPDLLAKVQQVEDGTSHADMVQDLSDLAALGNANLSLLQAIGVSVEKLQMAEASASEMSKFLAQMNGESATNNEAKIIRDKAYTLLKRAVDEVRDTGKYVFRKNPEKLKGFTSAYYRKLNRSRTEKSTEDIISD
ncbi:hypothetical protein QWY93_15810 [Echinicola jeungdonensis]|uniref:DUF3102 domain-containing protein n=1 Tax=Echinicola jeungdonensis TaxID=709343 RepID=A0ABV5J8X8_9BACT|nr:hypothetical protein [Echinicola jeungdonensis]MDN3670787.1 hypothetical protein [Echinicola jeungdonensis]